MNRMFLALMLMCSSLYGQSIPMGALPAGSGHVSVPAPTGRWLACGDVSSSSGCVPTSSTAVYDSTGSGNAGIWAGIQSGTNFWYSSGSVLPYAGAFNGNSRVIIPQTPALTFDRTNSFSACAWVYAAAYFTGANFSAYVVSSQVDSSPYNGWVFSMNNSGQLGIWFGSDSVSNNGISLTSTATLSLNQWYNVCFTYDGSSTAAGLALYINGASASGSTTGTTFTGTMVTPGVGISFATLFSQMWNSWNGQIEDLQIWNSALTAAQISSVHSAGPGAPTPTAIRKANP